MTKEAVEGRQNEPTHKQRVPDDLTKKQATKIVTTVEYQLPKSNKTTEAFNPALYL